MRHMLVHPPALSSNHERPSLPLSSVNLLPKLRLFSKQPWDRYANEAYTLLEMKGYWPMKFR